MHDPTPLRDDAPALPCAGGLLAGTLALMTCWVKPEADAGIGAAQQRALIARKLISNLYFLREHPDLPGGLRLVMTKLHARWSDIAQAQPAPAAAAGDASTRALH